MQQPGENRLILANTDGQIVAIGGFSRHLETCNAFPSHNMADAGKTADEGIGLTVSYRLQPCINIFYRFQR